MPPPEPGVNVVRYDSQSNQPANSPKAQNMQSDQPLPSKRENLVAEGLRQQIEQRDQIRQLQEQ